MLRKKSCLGAWVMQNFRNRYPPLQGWAGQGPLLRALRACPSFMEEARSSG